MKRGLIYILGYLFLFVVFVSDRNNQNSQNDIWIIVAVLTLVFGLLFWLVAMPTKYALTDLDADQHGVRIKYLDKDEVKEEAILWTELSVYTHNSISKHPVKALAIKKNDKKLATFYAIHPLIDDKYIDNLHDKLQQLKTAYT
ncbi:MAG TPA: hypothetical protein VK835_04790 [Bacteroidia bacterium]|nr:hypothetical protein [Bacteroidia bacterium]